jgi:prevent-host-death family protein
MKKIALSEVKDDLSKFLRLAASEEIIITRHGKPAGILVGFASEDDWFDYRLENDPRFLNRIASARESLRVGKGVKIEDLAAEGRAERRQSKH